MEPICGSCPFYRGRHTDPEQAAAAERAGLLPRGQCQRFPEIVPKHDTDSCGEHPLVRWTYRRQLAELIAEKVAAALAAPPAKRPASCAETAHRKGKT